MKVWTVESVALAMQTLKAPEELEGFVRKEYCGKASVNLKVEDGAREFISKISTSARDRDNEVIDPTGISLAQYKKNPVILWGHRYDEPAIGKCQWIKADKKTGELIAKGVIATGTSKAEDVFSLMQQEILNTVSIGFIPVEGHIPTPDDIKKNAKLKGVRWIHDKTIMLEYSIVNVPSNPEATIDSVSKGLLEIPATIQQDMGIFRPANTPTIIKKALPYESTPTDGIDTGWDVTFEKNGASLDDLKAMAAWMDNDDPGKRAGYKFLHHRRGNGNPLVYDALVTAMSRLQNFMVRIPDTDRKGVYQHLARHYRDDFGKEPPAFAAEPKELTLAGIDRATVKGHQSPVAHKPIRVVTIRSQKPIKVDQHFPLSSEEIQEQIQEQYEFRVQGKV